MRTMASHQHRNDIKEQENFKKFFEHWIGEHDRYLRDLLTAAAAPDDGGDKSESESRIRVLIVTVVAHYEHYYRTKSASAKRDVLPTFNPTWTSSTEKIFVWIVGWRPSATVHLLYSKSGLQLEPKLAQLVGGVATGDLADLSPDLVFFGGSTTRSAARSEGFQVACLAGLLEKLGVAERVSVVGTSYGGFMAYHLARALGVERVGRVVIASSDLLKGEEDDRALRERAGVESVSDLLLPWNTENLRKLLGL